MYKFLLIFFNLFILCLTFFSQSLFTNNSFKFFTARSILNGTKINLYKFWAFYVIYLTFHISFLIFSYHMHYKNNFHNVLS